jgi:hypothetical protein
VDAEAPREYVDHVCKLTGAPVGTRIHWLLYQDPAEPSGKLLLVHFIAARGKRLSRRMHPSRLGAALFTHTTRDMGNLYARLVGAGARIELPPTRIDDDICMRVRGPNEELFEFIAA